MGLQYHPSQIPLAGGKTLQGWVNAYKEGGWLPKWASPGYRGGMLGTAADIVMVISNKLLPTPIANTLRLLICV